MIWKKCLFRNNNLQKHVIIFITSAVLRRHTLLFPWGDLVLACALVYVFVCMISPTGLGDDYWTTYCICITIACAVLCCVVLCCLVSSRLVHLKLNAVNYLPVTETIVLPNITEDLVCDFGTSIQAAKILYLIIWSNLRHFSSIGFV